MVSLKIGQIQEIEAMLEKDIWTNKQAQATDAVMDEIQPPLTQDNIHE